MMMTTFYGLNGDGELLRSACMRWPAPWDPVVFLAGSAVGPSGPPRRLDEWTSVGTRAMLTLCSN